MKQNSNNEKPGIKEIGAIWQVKITIPTAVSSKSIQILEKEKHVKLNIIMN